MIDLHKLDKFRLKDRERRRGFYGCTGIGETVFSRCIGDKVVQVILLSTAWDGNTAFNGSAGASARRRTDVRY